ncbi:methyltransferase domain-containing protein [Ornithinimicrobium sp. Arc0846-15]|nr:methyltransferase domain-containing protein [Ornithinimicrobium laminariae]
MNPEPDDAASVRHEPLGQGESVSASQLWWDAEAPAYYSEHREQLGDVRLSWGPEQLTEAELGALGPLMGRDVLEFGAGSGQGARWCFDQGARVVASDLSLAMLRIGQHIDHEHGVAPEGYVTADAAGLPFADESFDIAFSAYGALPFVADPGLVLSEVARVLRPGGRLAFSLTHPIRWAFLDEPGPEGLSVAHSYFDLDPYVERDANGAATYVEHHATMGDRVRQIRRAGLFLEDLIEPEWPATNTAEWGGWSPLRGAYLPGTAIFVATKPIQH